MKKTLFLLLITTVLNLCACTSNNTKKENSDVNVRYALNTVVMTDNYDNKETEYILDDNFFTNEYGQVVKITDENETNLFEYDIDGNLKKITCTEGNNTISSSERLYENGKLISYTISNKNVKSETIVDMEINEDGSVAKKTEYTHTVFLSDDSEEDSIYIYEYEYDQHGQISSITHSGEYNYTLILEYDEVGNLSKISAFDENNFEFYNYKFGYILVNDNNLRIKNLDSYSSYDLLVAPFNWVG